MGNGAAAQHLFFTYAYQKEHLNKDLSQHFLQDPKNAQIVQNIIRLQEILSAYPAICKVSRCELANKYEPTCLHSAQLEYQRLLGLYQENMRLKSVDARIGFVACPLGHFCEQIKGEKHTCSVCTHDYKDGYICSFCDYCMCEPCSIIYCVEGHAMHLWTHAEAVHVCIVCKTEPICSGYRCYICQSNICDACTDKPGRLIVQRKIRDDLQEFIEYFAAHVVESNVAQETLDNHERDMIEHPFPTILDLMTKRVLFGRLKQIVAAQVILYEITKEVKRLRAVIAEFMPLSVPARREQERPEYFIQGEIDRLNAWLAIREVARSPSKRAEAVICCPLGHACGSYIGCPKTYLDRNRIAEKRRLLSIKEMHNEDSSSSSGSEWSMGDEEEEGDEGNSENNHSEHKNEDEEYDDMLLLGDVPLIGFPENNDGSGGAGGSVASSSYLDCTENETRASSAQLVPAQRISLTNPPPCRVCHRKVAQGFHCEYCEYDLCSTCGELYCIQGHRVRVWNADVSSSANNQDLLENGSVRSEQMSRISNGNQNRRQSSEIMSSGLSVSSASVADNSKQQQENQVLCVLCRQSMVSGYMCELCSPESAYICDMCTTADGRKQLRKRWDEELDEIMVYMKREKNFSDIARMHSWQTRAVIISVKLLVEHVREMKEQQRRAALQVKYKSFIDEVKAMRKEITAHVNICAVARIEAANQPDYVYENKKSVKLEIQRLSGLLQASRTLQSAVSRQEHQFACPLGHGTVPVAGEEHYAMLLKHAGEFRSKLFGLEADAMRTAQYSPETSAMSRHGQCAVCRTEDLGGGRFCVYCEYVVCCTCCVIYCRNAHACRIWTFPDAVATRCDICQTSPIAAGYRCLECNTDVCNICTTRETRISLQLFPLREARRILSYFTLVQDQSDIARNYLHRYGDYDQQQQSTNNNNWNFATTTEKEKHSKSSSQVLAASVTAEYQELAKTSSSLMSTGGGQLSRPHTSGGGAARDIPKPWYETEPQYIFDSSLIWNRDVGPLQVGGSFAHTCSLLNELRAAKVMVDEEIGLKKLRASQHAGMRANARSRQQDIVRAWNSDL